MKINSPLIFGVGVGWVGQIGIALHFAGRNDWQWVICSIPGIIVLSWLLLQYEKHNGR